MLKSSCGNESEVGTTVRSLICSLLHMRRCKRRECRTRNASSFPLPPKYRATRMYFLRNKSAPPSKSAVAATSAPPKPKSSIVGFVVPKPSQGVAKREKEEKRSSTPDLWDYSN